MKKNLPILFIILTVFVVIVGILFNLETSNSVQIIRITLEGKKVKLIVADTPAEREKGLMNVREIDKADGMIFLFSQAEYQRFWNKNTLMDLDVYWMLGDTVVGKSFLPSIEKSKNIVIIDSPIPVDRVIEVPR